MPDTAYVATNTDYLQGLNSMKLAQIAMLNDNWDGYGAEHIPYDTLHRAQHLIHALHVQPEIFPTASGAIQIEYEKDNGDYLEFQFTGEGACEVFRCIGDNEEYFRSLDNPESLNTLVEDFYGYTL